MRIHMPGRVGVAAALTTGLLITVLAGCGPASSQAGSTTRAKHHSTRAASSRATASKASASASSTASGRASSSANQVQPSTTGQSATSAPASQSTSATSSSRTQSGPTASSGWTIDMSDTFDGALNSRLWTPYGWGDPKQGDGGLGYISKDNVTTRDGKLILRVDYRNGNWYNAGLSTGDYFSTPGGRWEVRAKFPKAKGVGYAFLLYPGDGSWPPEVDFAEGRVNGPQVMGAYHWDSDNKQALRFFDNTDMSGWHTYGVYFEGKKLVYTFDGKPWATIENDAVTSKAMWLGMQTAAMDPNGSAKQSETVDGGVPNASTPAVNEIQVDWVAHYKRT